MRARRVLLIEDDPGIAELLQWNLEREGLEVEHHVAAEPALVALQRSNPDAILLDLGLPGMGGLELCRQVRRERRTPILILTSRQEEGDKVLGLESGADDYVTKPFGVRELIARVKALIRRAEPGSTPEAVLRFADLTIDTETKLAARGGRALPLTGTEYRILEVLARAPRRVFSREQLLERLADGATETYDRTIDSHLARLRAKLEDDPKDPRYLETVRGLGYRFVG